MNPTMMEAQHLRGFPTTLGFKATAGFSLPPQHVGVHLPPNLLPTATSPTSPFASSGSGSIGIHGDDHTASPSPLATSAAASSSSSSDDERDDSTPFPSLFPCTPELEHHMQNPRFVACTSPDLAAASGGALDFANSPMMAIASSASRRDSKDASGLGCGARASLDFAAASATAASPTRPNLGQSRPSFDTSSIASPASATLIQARLAAVAAITAADEAAAGDFETVSSFSSFATKLPTVMSITALSSLGASSAATCNVATGDGVAGDKGIGAMQDTDGISSGFFVTPRPAARSYSTVLQQPAPSNTRSGAGSSGQHHHHVGWEGLLEFSRTSGCSGVLGLRTLDMETTCTMDTDDAPDDGTPNSSNTAAASGTAGTLGSAGGGSRSASGGLMSTASSVALGPAVPASVPSSNSEERCKIEICCTAHPSSAARRLLKSVVRGLKACQDPEATAEGMGGTYFFLNDAGKKAAILKPCDEEPLAPNNPKGYIGRQLGDPGWKPTVRVGEAAMREVAACLLDHDGFARVPTSVLVRARHPIFCYNRRMSSVRASITDLVGAGNSFINATPTIPGVHAYASGASGNGLAAFTAQGSGLPRALSGPAAAVAMGGAGVATIPEVPSVSPSPSNASPAPCGDIVPASSATAMELSNAGDSMLDFSPFHSGCLSHMGSGAMDTSSHGAGPNAIASSISRSNSTALPPLERSNSVIIPATTCIGFPETAPLQPGSLTLASPLQPARPSGLLSLAANAAANASGASPGRPSETSNLRSSFLGPSLLGGSSSIRGPLPMKLGSLQEFVSHECDTSEMGASRFAASDVHRIGILDIRLFNTDRHAGNMLCVRIPPGTAAATASLAPGNAGAAATAAMAVAGVGAPEYSLIPIDHGFCLPETLEAPYFEWQHWPQAAMPFSTEELAYIARLDVQADKALLQKELPNLRPECLRVLEVGTTLLQMCAAAGLTLYDIACAMERPFVEGVEEASELERACAAAKEQLEALAEQRREAELAAAEAAALADAQAAASDADDILLNGDMLVGSDSLLRSGSDLASVACMALHVALSMEMLMMNEELEHLSPRADAGGVDGMTGLMSSAVSGGLPRARDGTVGSHEDLLFEWEEDAAGAGHFGKAGTFSKSSSRASRGQAVHVGSEHSPDATSLDSSMSSADRISLLFANVDTTGGYAPNNSSANTSTGGAAVAAGGGNRSDTALATPQPKVARGVLGIAIIARSVHVPEGFMWRNMKGLGGAVAPGAKVRGGVAGGAVGGTAAALAAKSKLPAAYPPKVAALSPDALCSVFSDMDDDEWELFMVALRDRIAAKLASGVWKQVALDNSCAAMSCPRF